MSTEFIILAQGYYLEQTSWAQRDSATAANHIFNIRRLLDDEVHAEIWCGHPDSENVSWGIYKPYLSDWKPLALFSATADEMRQRDVFVNSRLVPWVVDFVNEAVRDGVLS